MIEQPSWMPGWESLRAAWEDELKPRNAGKFEAIRALISVAVGRALVEMEDRHKREMLEARLEVLEEANSRQYPYQSILDQLDRYGAELAALNSEAK